MKAKQLIQELLKLDPNTVVFIASDAEGNSYSAASDVYTENRNLSFNGKTDNSSVEFGVLVDDGSEDKVFKRPAAILYPV